MINNNFFKLLVLTPADKDSGADKILSDKNPSLYGKPRGSELFHQEYAAIVLQDGLTKREFLGSKYKELREAAFTVCPEQILLIGDNINKLTADDDRR